MKDITWIKKDAGEYESSDGRFYILKTYDRIFGNHWVLFDKTSAIIINNNFMNTH